MRKDVWSVGHEYAPGAEGAEVGAHEGAEVGADDGAEVGADDGAALGVSTGTGLDSSHLHGSVSSLQPSLAYWASNFES